MGVGRWVGENQEYRQGPGRRWGSLCMPAFLQWLRRPELRPTLQAGDGPETGNADIAGRCGGTVRPSRAGSFSKRLWSQRSSDRNAKKCRSSSRRQLNQRRSNCLKEGKEVREGSRTLYTISYTVDDASNEVSFYYDSNKGTIIRVKNQERVAWRKDQDS